MPWHLCRIYAPLLTGKLPQSDHILRAFTNPIFTIFLMKFFFSAAQIEKNNSLLVKIFFGPIRNLFSQF